MPPDLTRTLDLFAQESCNIALDEGAWLLRGYARSIEHELLAALEDVVTAAQLRHMMTPGGLSMSVAMTNCGNVGWVSDRNGYRYDASDNISGHRWPAMPLLFAELATRAAEAGGYPAFKPDACLINRYEPGSRLSLHQDRNEHDFSKPIVSVSLGLDAVFLWGGQTRNARVRRIPLTHGDVVVWGGATRLTFHGVLPLKDGVHPLTGHARFNLTFRQAL